MRIVIWNSVLQISFVVCNGLLFFFSFFFLSFFVHTGFGRKDVVEHLLENGANVHARDDGGLIPLHNACSFGHAEVVQLLLRHGADPNSRDNWNYTPLHEAAIKGKIDVCIGQLESFVLFSTLLLLGNHLLSKKQSSVSRNTDLTGVTLITAHTPCACSDSVNFLLWNYIVCKECKVFRLPCIQLCSYAHDWEKI